MPWDETPNYIRSGHGSTDCDRMRTKTLSVAQGIKAIICFKGDKSSIQSYLFSKAKGWTMSKAKTWFKAHGEAAEEQIGVTHPASPKRYADPPDSCVCRRCGHVLENPSEHCPDIKCPKCGAPMHRKSGPEQKEVFIGFRTC